MKFFNNIPKVFFGFLIASALIWLLINLSKTYTSEVIYQLNFENLPQDKIYKAPPKTSINLNIKGTGFKLLAENFSKRTITLNLEKLQQKNKSNYFFLTKNLQGYIQKQLPSTIELMEIETDSIFIELDKLASKKVKLIPNTNLNFQLGYDLAKPIKVIPETITISGIENELITIDNLELENIDLQNISENTTKTVTIISPKNSSIKFSQKQADVYLEVDKFTEGEVKVPITIINIPSNTELNIFPKKATITYKVGLSNFNKITDDSFKLVCDYQKATKEGVNFLIPELKEKPSFVSSVRVSPNKIDFLINK